VLERNIQIGTDPFLAHDFQQRVGDLFWIAVQDANPPEIIDVQELFEKKNKPVF
jgi:hypothetical protein